MITCKCCGNIFKLLQEIDGKVRNLASRKFCLECSPFKEHNKSKHPLERRYLKGLSEQEFKALVAESENISELIDKARIRKSGASYEIIKSMIARFNVDISHFRSGVRCSAYKRSMAKRFNLDEALKVHDRPRPSHGLKLRLIKEGLLNEICSQCNLGPDWNGNKLSLQLDHINGNRCDDRIENLRILCPNCHSQTNTFGTKIRAKPYGGLVN